MTIQLHWHGTATLHLTSKKVPWNLLALVCWLGLGVGRLFLETPRGLIQSGIMFSGMWGLRKFGKKHILVRMILNVKLALHMAGKEARWTIPSPWGFMWCPENKMHHATGRHQLAEQRTAYSPLFYSQDKYSRAMQVIRCCTVWLFSLLPPLPPPSVL